MPDATRLPHPSSSSAQTVCIEIKPKYGDITKCDTIRPDHIDIKHNHARYRLHQELKKKEGLIHKVNDYNPLDLFSGDRKRIKYAVCALLDQPQNNLVVFINGQPQHRDGNNDDKDDDAISQIMAALSIHRPEQHINCTKTAAHDFLSDILTEILVQEEALLSNISSVQRMCLYDIEGVYTLYCHLMGMQIDSVSAQNDRIQRLLHTLSREEQVGVVREYVMATTAKDCSLMIAIQPVKYTSINDNDNYTGVMLQTQNRCGQVHLGGASSFQYRVTVVDVDRKSVSKIPKHYELDKEIMRHAMMSERS